MEVCGGVIVFIVAVFILVVILYHVFAPKYKITLAGMDSAVYEDPNVKVSFGFKNTENLRKLIQIPFEIHNKTSQPMQISWDSCVFVNPSGNSCRVIHSGVKLINKEAPQSPTMIASNSRISDILIPMDSIKWGSGGEDSIGEWKYSLLLKKWAGKASFKFSVLLLLKIGDENKPYEFEFKAAKPNKG